MYQVKVLYAWRHTYHSKLEEEKEKEHDYEVIAQENIKLKYHSKDDSEKRGDENEESFPSDP